LTHKDLCSTQHRDPPSIQRSVTFKKQFQGVSFENMSGDIIDEPVDVIGILERHRLFLVNAANNTLNHTNGLANSILVKGGQ
jgi:hypothetical protein